MQAENIHRPYRHTTIKLYSHEISRLHHSLEWNILVTLVYSTPDCGVTYTYTYIHNVSEKTFIFYL